MSISPIAGTGSVQHTAPPKPESSEAPGAPDRDHDADNAPKAAPAKRASAAGRVDIKA